MTSYVMGCEIWNTYMENLEDIFPQVNSQFCIAAKPFIIFLTL